MFAIEHNPRNEKKKERTTCNHHTKLNLKTFAENVALPENFLNWIGCNISREGFVFWQYKDSYLIILTLSGRNSNEN